MTPELCDIAEELGSGISEMTSLGASLAAVTIAIFLVMPVFHAAIAAEGRKVFFGYTRSRRLFAGFTALATASALFIAEVFVGIIGRHIPTSGLLFTQEIMCAIGLLLSFAAIVIVWAVIRWGE